MLKAKSSYRTIEILLIALIGSIGHIPNDKKSDFLDNHQDAGVLIKDLAGVTIGRPETVSSTQLKLF